MESLASGENCEPALSRHFQDRIQSFMAVKNKQGFRPACGARGIPVWPDWPAQ